MDNDNFTIGSEDNKRGTRLALLLSMTAALIYLAISTVRLDGQGLYYDEVFQAVASFAFVGQKPSLFAILQVHDIPIMNMSYVGAIKTAVYGLYLKISGQPFSVISWRLTGISFLCVGITLFGAIGGRRLTLAGLTSFFFLLITDITVILTTRFDWGPAALAMVFRLMIISIWMDGELKTDLRPGNSFLIGALCAISLFEKLSAIVLIIPVILMIGLNPIRRNTDHLKAFLLGGLLGSMPLIFANLYGFVKEGYFVSLQAQSIYFPKEYSWNTFFFLLKEFLALGAGGEVQKFILGIRHPSLDLREMIQISVFLLLMVGWLIHSRFNSKYYGMSAVMLLCYAVVVASIYFLPAATWAHHWVIATPFQYAAMALFLAGFLEDIRWRKNPFLKYPLTAAVAVFILLRLAGIVFLEQAFWRENTSIEWDASLTQMAKFAGGKSNDAIFVVGDWGIANQLICFINGKPGVVYQLGAEEGNLEEMTDIIRARRPSEIYLVFVEPPYFTDMEIRTAIAGLFQQALSPEWEVRPVDEQVRGFRSIVLIKFIKVASSVGLSSSISKTPFSNPR
jgi:hypothetical protein